MIGRTIAHYRIEAKLGEGGMGAVYRAWDTRLERPVALKFLPAALADDEEARARLVREARAAARLQHPAICTVHEIGEAEGQVFIAMTWLAGPDLRASLKAGPLSVEEALEVAIPVAEALAAAHAAGIVHRDVKPANILRDDAGHPVVTDFGLARMMAESVQLTQSGVSLGTPAYMAPEQVRGEAVTPAADVWALGVLLHEMLAGRPPFASEQRDAVLYGILHAEATPLGELRDDVPEGFERLVQRCLAKDPARRYPSAAEVASELRRLREQPAESMKTARPSVLRRWRRRPAVLGMLAAAVLLLVAVSWRIVATGPPAIDAIAVLPFTNLSGDPGQDPLADGLTEGLITELQKLVAGSALRVISRTSVMPYKRSDQTLGEIAKALGVDAVLETSVRRDAGRVIISTKLLRARPEEPLWVERFERDLEDVLAIQAQIAGRIAEETGVELSPEAEELLARATARTVDPRALEIYLEGQAGPGAMYGRRAFEAQRDAYQAALTIDAEFAEAYGALARLYADAAFFTLVPPRQVLPSAKLMAEKALELDPRSAVALAAKAAVAFYFEWRREEPDAMFRRAISFKPSDPELRSAYARYLVHVGRFDEAIAQFEQERAQSPGADPGLYSIGWAHLYDGRPELTLEIARRHRELHPDDPLAFGNIAWALTLLGEHDRAVAAADSLAVALPMVSAWGMGEVFYWIQGLVYANAGLRDRAEAALEAMQELAASDYVEPFYAAQMHALLGDLDAAFADLDRAFEERSAALVDLEMDMGYLADDPRYQDLARRVGLSRD